jgi:hypothetical protein
MSLFLNIDSLRQKGFVGFQTKGELYNDCACIPKVPGIYLVLFISKLGPSFLEIGCGGFFKGKNPNVPVSELRSRWVSETPVIYIGKAGGRDSKATLNSRLKQYFAFGQGKPVGHYGGRYIWQLANPKELVVCWRPIQTEEPRDIEAVLISDFVTEFGRMPFANLKA